MVSERCLTFFPRSKVCFEASEITFDVICLSSKALSAFAEEIKEEKKEEISMESDDDSTDGTSDDE